MTDNRSDLGKILKQRRVMIPLALKELAHASGVSSSHIGRIERGKRFPSARILHKIAKPLSFEEGELLTLAGYLSTQPSTEAERPGGGRLDPYVAAVPQEPVHIQQAIVTILIILKSMARGVAESKGGKLIAKTMERLKIRAIPPLISLPNISLAYSSGASWKSLMAY